MVLTMPGRILAAIDDLFFLVKVKDAATRAGVEMDLAQTPESLASKARELKPALIVLDLNASSLRPLDSIAALKADPQTRDTPILAFVSHVQVDLKQQAQNAGADHVVARSAFSEKLPIILQQAAARDN